MRVGPTFPRAIPGRPVSPTWRGPRERAGATSAGARAWSSGTRRRSVTDSRGWRSRRTTPERVSRRNRRRRWRSCSRDRPASGSAWERTSTRANRRCGRFSTGATSCFAKSGAAPCWMRCSDAAPSRPTSTIRCGSSRRSTRWSARSPRSGRASASPRRWSSATASGRSRPRRRRASSRWRTDSGSPPYAASSSGRCRAREPWPRSLRLVRWSRRQSRNKTAGRLARG